MLHSVKYHSTFDKIQLCNKMLIPRLAVSVSEYRQDLELDYSTSASSSRRSISDSNVAIFWDLDNKPPKSFPPFDAALRLKKTAQKFGFVKYMIAYANQHAFSYVPPSVRVQRHERKALNKLETWGVVKPAEPYVCRVCGRRFYTNEKLINHFRLIHEREHTKRLNQIESARGKRRVNLVGRYAMKMEKYRNAARDILTPRVGYGLADELKRAGFCVRTVTNKPQAADAALRLEIVDMMDRRIVECLVLVSDDSDFVRILNEARERCLKTVVVGDINNGVLKRAADAAFSWQEIMIGKAKKEAVSIVGKWKDRNLLRRLEWTYDPEMEKKKYRHEVESEDSGVEQIFSDEYEPRLETKTDGPWWKIEPQSRDETRPPQ